MGCNHLTPGIISERFLTNSDPLKLQKQLEKMYRKAIRKASKKDIASFSEAKCQLNDLLSDFEEFGNNWIR